MVTEPSSSRPLCYVLPTGLVNARCSPVKTADVPSSAVRLSVCRCVHRSVQACGRADWQLCKLLIKRC